MAEITAQAITWALVRKLAVPFSDSATDIAFAIRANELDLAIMPGVRPAKTFEAGFIEVFGQKLDGGKVKRRVRK